MDKQQAENLTRAVRQGFAALVVGASGDAELGLAIISRDIDPADVGRFVLGGGRAADPDGAPVAAEAATDVDAGDTPATIRETSPSSASLPAPADLPRDGDAE